MSEGRLRALAAASAVVFASVAAVGLTGGATAGLAAAANEATAAQEPYDGPHVAPGTVEAENFDTGGEGVAFSETSDLQWDIYRRSSVDIDYSLSKYWVERIDPSEWLEYTVEAEASGTYELTLRAAASSESTVDVVVDGETRLEGVTVPDSDHAWQSVEAGTLSLDAGEHVVRFEADGGDWRFDRFSLAAADAGGDDGTATPTPTATEPASTTTTAATTAGTTTTTTVETTTETITVDTATETRTVTETETETEATTTEPETETEATTTEPETETETTATTTETETTTTETETETETETTETEIDAGSLKDALGSDEGPESAPSPDETGDESNECPAPAEVREDVEEELREESAEAVRQDLSGPMVECLPRDLKAELGYETATDDETTAEETTEETDAEETSEESTETTVDDTTEADTPADGASDPLNGLAEDGAPDDEASGFGGDSGPPADGEPERRERATPTATDDGRAARDGSGERGTASPRRTTAAASADDGGERLQDTDGDGVIDSEDYAPRDASVQRRSDVTGSDDPIGSGSKLLVLLTAAVAPLAYRQFG